MNTKAMTAKNASNVAARGIKRRSALDAPSGARKDQGLTKATLSIPRTYTATGLALPEGLSFDEWQAIGERLRVASAACLWWVGDWLAFGERRYGEAYAQALDDTEWEYETLRAAKWVAEKIESVRRRTLSWSHHKEVAALEAGDQDRLLDQAVAENWTRSELRAAARRVKHGEATVDEQFLKWAERVGAEFERIKADTELLDKIKRGELELVGFEGGRPVVRDQQREIRERIDAALSGSGENKALRAWQWRRVDRDAKHGGWSVVRSSDETPEAVKRALELKFGVEVEVKAVATANGA